MVFDTLANDRLELRGVPRLKDIAKNVPFVDCSDDRLDIGISSEEHADGIGLELSSLSEELVAGHAGHPLVAQYELDLIILKDLDRVLACEGSQDPVLAVELMAQAVEHVRLVVDDQQRMPTLLH